MKASTLTSSEPRVYLQRKTNFRGTQIKELTAFCLTLEAQLSVRNESHNITNGGDKTFLLVKITAEDKIRVRMMYEPTWK